MVTCHISPLHCFFPPKQQSLQILLGIKSFLFLVMISFGIISNLQKSCRKSIRNFHISFTQIHQLSAFWPHLLYNSLSMRINIYPHTLHICSQTHLYIHTFIHAHMFFLIHLRVCWKPHVPLWCKFLYVSSLRTRPPLTYSDSLLIALFSVFFYVSYVGTCFVSF